MSAVKELKFTLTKLRYRTDIVIARVYSVLPAGSETIITVQSGTLNLSVKINGFTGIKMDDLLWLNLDPEKINYYDIKTERLIQA